MIHRAKGKVGRDEDVERQAGGVRKASHRGQESTRYARTNLGDRTMRSAVAFRFAPFTELRGLIDKYGNNVVT